jgi:hypothetical protein
MIANLKIRWNELQFASWTNRLSAGLFFQRQHRYALALDAVERRCRCGLHGLGSLSTSPASINNAISSTTMQNSTGARRA